MSSWKKVKWGGGGNFSHPIRKPWQLGLVCTQNIFLEKPGILCSGNLWQAFRYWIFRQAKFSSEKDQNWTTSTIFFFYIKMIPALRLHTVLRNLSGFILRNVYGCLLYLHENVDGRHLPCPPSPLPPPYKYSSFKRDDGHSSFQNQSYVLMLWQILRHA
jgi:hypothetical protein